MEIIFYLLIFAIGTVFGSFFTLAVYRIPLHQDITHKRSYCPNCNHKLGFWDMIPVFSYIFLRGKCRYCKEKIRIRYLCLEILTGLVFLLFAISLNFSFKTLEISKIISLIFGILYIAGIIIIAGIDKERKNVQKGVLIYEVIIAILYIVYLYTVGTLNIYRYIIYLLILFVLIIISKLLDKKNISNYPITILELAIIMIIFTGGNTYTLSVIVTLIIISLNFIKQKIVNIQNKNKNENIAENQYYKNLSIAFYLVICNLISTIIINFINI